MLNNVFEDTLKDFSLASWASYLEDIYMVESGVSADLYSIFNLFLGVSKFVTVYISSTYLPICCFSVRLIKVVHNDVNKSGLFEA